MVRLFIFIMPYVITTVSLGCHAESFYAPNKEYGRARGWKRDHRFLHGHAHTQVTKSLLIIMVQHIESLHARDEIKLIKYATHFRGRHAPTPNTPTPLTTVFRRAREAFDARPAHGDCGGSAVRVRGVCGLGGRVLDGWMDV